MIKDFFTTLMIIALSLFIIAAVPNDSDAAIYEDTLRLHILANSDSEEDQSLKLLIRDKVLGKYGEILKTGESVEGAISLSEFPEVTSEENGPVSSANESQRKQGMKASKQNQGRADCPEWHPERMQFSLKFLRLPP